MDVNRYMLAIMPPEQLTKEIAAIRVAFAEKYNCKAALKPPVHITLIKPFDTDKESIKVVASHLREFARNHIPYPITLKDYDNFKTSETVFIHVIYDDLMTLFQQDLIMKMKQLTPKLPISSAKHFHPHITIGYRDIPPDLFDAAAFAYKQKQFFATFIVDAIYLWKHDGQRWQIEATMPLGTMGAYASR